MVEQIKKYIMCVCYDDENVGYSTREEIYVSDRVDELAQYYRSFLVFKKNVVGCNIKNARGVLLFGYVGKKKFVK